MSPTFTTAEVLARLEILYRKLEADGLHVRANTVALAIEEIKRLAGLPSHPLDGRKDEGGNAADQIKGFRH